MRLDVLQSQIDARYLIQKADQLERVEAGASSVAAIASQWWRNDVLPLIGWAKKKEPAVVTQRAKEMLRRFWARTNKHVSKLLEDQLKWTDESGYQTLVDVLPRAYWLRLATMRGAEISEAIDYGAAGSVSAAKDLYRPMSRADIRRIMFMPPEQAADGLNWEERIKKYSKLTTEPDIIADHITRGLRAGRNPNDIAKKLLPWVKGNQAAATRIARTEMLRVSQEGLREQWGAFDDVIAGYKILATFDELTRPHHRTRHGDIYMKPGPDGSLPEGAKGTPDQRPIVPDEPNCRCYESPVLKELPGVFQDVVRKDRTVATMDGTQEDPVTMSRWFDGQKSGRKQRILGARRFNVLQGNLDRAGAGRNVTWADAINTSDGKLEKVAVITDEPARATLTRRATNERAFAKRATLLAQDKPELFPGLKLVGKGPPLPPAPPPGPVDPPPSGPPPHDLTGGQRQAVIDWQDGGHSRTRDYYREKSNKTWGFAETKAQVRKDVGKLDAALKKMPMATTPKGNARPLWRGLKNVSEDDLNALLQAESIDFDNYQATSRSRKIAETFSDGAAGSDNVLLRMKTASGRDLGALGGRAAREKTVLLERGRRFRVVKVSTSTTSSGGRLHEITLEEIAPAKDSPLLSGKIAPRRRLWDARPPVPKVTMPLKPAPKPPFEEIPRRTLAAAKKELEAAGLTRDALKSGRVGCMNGHDAFWEELRKLNGTADTSTGIRGGIMAQREQILSAFDRKMTKLSREVAALERALPARGSEAFKALGKSDYISLEKLSPQERAYRTLSKTTSRLRAIGVKRGVQESWFKRFAEIADESLVKDERLGVVKWGIGRKKRAAAYQYSNEIKIWRVEEEGLSTWAHEFGHHVEYRNERVQKRLVAWRRMRSGGHPMKSVYPWKPKSKEIGWPDAWYNGYAGRVYAGRDSTEILSMGMQFTTTTEELAEVAGKDYDHVAMIWAILRGY